MTPDDLVQIERIKQVKHRYLRGLDTKDWALVESCLTDDATASYGGGAVVLDDRDQIMTFLRDSMGAETFLSSHRCGQAEIALDGDGRTATGTWALEDHVILEDLDIGVHGAAFYEDTYARGDDDEWRIATTGYLRTYEELVPRSSIDGLKVTASLFRTGGRSELL